MSNLIFTKFIYFFLTNFKYDFLTEQVAPYIVIVVSITLLLIMTVHSSPFAFILRAIAIYKLLMDLIH